MNYGALFFLIGFLGLASSWFGLVLVPQLQVGRQELVDVDGSLYPSRRPGMAEQGAQVYRANGCATCHSRQVRQSGTVFDVLMSESGTNAVALAEAVKTINLRLKLNLVQPFTTPMDIVTGVDKAAADIADSALKNSGAKYAIRIRPVGPDIERGWGRRATVAQDYLWDNPVMVGSQRLGPDLANVGARQPDPNWHLKHLYAPASMITGSTMPPYRFLFEKRKMMGRTPSSDALQFTDGATPTEGYEIVPTDDARSLVAYLLSLRADVPLFEAPMSAK
jgi:cbb3-type cytochrome oxidase cytochrome c subunit